MNYLLIQNTKWKLASEEIIMGIKRSNYNLKSKSFKPLVQGEQWIFVWRSFGVQNNYKTSNK